MSLMRTVYVGVAAVIALVIWLVAKSGNPVKPAASGKILSPQPARQQELFAARNRIRRQIEVLKTSPHPYGAPSPDALLELEKLLRDIEGELKIVGTG